MFSSARTCTSGCGCITATGNVNPGPIVKLYNEWQGADADAQQAGLDAAAAVGGQFLELGRADLGVLDDAAKRAVRFDQGCQFDQAQIRSWKASRTSWVTLLFHASYRRRASIGSLAS